MTSPDIFDQSSYFTQSFNRYSYAINNPMKYTDPSGYKWIKYWREIQLYNPWGVSASIVFRWENDYTANTGYGAPLQSGHVGGAGSTSIVGGGSGGSHGNYSGDVVGEIPTGVSGVISGSTSEVSLSTWITLKTAIKIQPQWISTLNKTSGIFGGVVGTIDNGLQAINDYNEGNTFQAYINGGQSVLYLAGTIMMLFPPTAVAAGTILTIVTISDYAQGFYEGYTGNENY